MRRAQTNLSIHTELRLLWLSWTQRLTFWYFLVVLPPPLLQATLDLPFSSPVLSLSHSVLIPLPAVPPWCLWVIKGGSQGQFWAGDGLGRCSPFRPACSHLLRRASHQPTHSPVTACWLLGVLPILRVSRCHPVLPFLLTPRCRYHTALVAVGGSFPLVCIWGLVGLLCHKILLNILPVGFWFFCFHVGVTGDWRRMLPHLHLQCYTFLSFKTWFWIYHIGLSSKQYQVGTHFHKALRERKVMS